MFYTETQKKMNQMSSRLERQNMFISVCVEQEYATIFPKTLWGQKHLGPDPKKEIFSVILRHAGIQAF